MKVGRAAMGSCMRVGGVSLGSPVEHKRDCNVATVEFNQHFINWAGF